MLAQVKLLLLRYARLVGDPLKVAVADRLIDEVRILESVESEESWPVRD
jgi:hypothetical protein